MSTAKRPPITTSLFEFFKSGPGPSSSHTIGPMAAGVDFRDRLGKLPPATAAGGVDIRVRLLGSLSATGQGHGTDKAVLTGLAGFTPADCPPSLPRGILELPPEKRCVPLGGRSLELGMRNIVFDSIDHDYPFSNTLICELLDSSGGVLFEMVYFSVGGGFIQWEGWTHPLRGEPVYPYASTAELQAHVEETGLTIAQIVLHNEMAITGAGRRDILEKLDGVVDIMRRAVDRGIAASGLLPGTLHVHRKAGDLARRAEAESDPLIRFMLHLNAYAFAVSEENAAGGIIVTTPTCGSAGVMPAVLRLLERHFSLGPEAIQNGMLAAAAIGFLAKHNAGIAGAEVGCQGEIGVASAMGAAMLAQARGFPARIVENAAEIALEHHLGLTCDPVGGYVQIPCIERNAMGALKAYNASLVAAAEDVKKHRVTLDMAIEAMGETGRDMNSKYKETSRGGLAVAMVEC